MPLGLLVLLSVAAALTGVNVHVELGADGAQDEAAGRAEHQRGEEDPCKESHFETVYLVVLFAYRVLLRIRPSRKTEGACRRHQGNIYQSQN